MPGLADHRIDLRHVDLRGRLLVIGEKRGLKAGAMGEHGGVKAAKLVDPLVCRAGGYRVAILPLLRVDALDLFRGGRQSKARIDAHHEPQSIRLLRRGCVVG